MILIIHLLPKSTKKQVKMDPIPLVYFVANPFSSWFPSLIMVRSLQSFTEIKLEINRQVVQETLRDINIKTSNSR